VRIATGAPIPPGADAVVPVEATSPVDRRAVAGRIGPRARDASGPLPAGCLVHVPVPAGGSIRRAGSDLAGWTRGVPPARSLTPAAIALAAGTGHGAIPVRPSRARSAPGHRATRSDPPGQPLGPAGIPERQRPRLVALIEAAAAEAHVLGIAADRLRRRPGRLCAGLVEGPRRHHRVGLACRSGRYDVVRAAFAEFGTIELWRVAVQPGKPFAFGTGSEPRATTARTQPGRATLLFGCRATRRRHS
jgi:molybdopterin molybdotransferase